MWRLLWHECVTDCSCLYRVPDINVPILRPDLSGSWSIAKKELVGRLTYRADFRFYSKHGHDCRLQLQAPTKPLLLPARGQFSKADRCRNKLAHLKCKVELAKHIGDMAEHEHHMEIMIRMWSEDNITLVSTMNPAGQCRHPAQHCHTHC